jgi:predicted O-methyltransferase YrrM
MDMPPGSTLVTVETGAVNAALARQFIAHAGFSGVVHGGGGGAR